MGTTLLLLLTFFTAGASPSTEVASALLERAPTERWIGGGFSAVFGGMSATRGVLLLGDRQSSPDERVAGGLLLSLGTVRLLDGFDRLFNPAPWEQRAAELESLPPKVRALRTRLWLIESARESRRLKWIRSSLLATNGMVYLYLYQHDSVKNGGLIYPAVTLLVLAVYRALSDTIAEQAEAKIEPSSNGISLRVDW